MKDVITDILCHPFILITTLSLLRNRFFGRYIVADVIVPIQQHYINNQLRNAVVFLLEGT